VEYKRILACSGLVDPAPYIALALDVLYRCAVRMRPDLRDKFDEIEEFILEEHTEKRRLELEAAIRVH